MNTMSSRDHILQRIRSCPTPAGPALPSPVPPEAAEDLLALFSRELEKLGGELILAQDAADGAAQLRALLADEQGLVFVTDRPLAREVGEHLAAPPASLEQMADCLASLAEAEYVIADTATVGLRLNASQPRSCYLLPEISVVIARREGMLLTLAEALADLERQGEMPTGFVFITGPSRTADIEKTVVIPAHGPKRLVAVLLGD